MSESIWVALITGGISLLGIIITAVLQTISTQGKISEELKKQSAEFQKQSEVADMKLEAKLENYMALTNAKIEELTREVREHNNFARRMPVLEEKAKRTDKRLEDLEKAHHTT